MILSKFVYTKIAPRNYQYWREKGYNVSSTGGRGGKNTGQRIKVKIEELLPGSNSYVSCKCNECGKKYIQRFTRNKEFCYSCRKIKQMTGNKLGTLNKGKPSKQVGENHPRWNPNKSEIKKYTNRVHWLTRKTYNEYKHLINPNNYKRTLCGIENGYQLDHKVSIKKAFELGWSPEQVADYTNLQMLSWNENRTKWY